MHSMPSEALADWVSRVAVTWGMDPADAAWFADCLVDANRRGIDSHGVIRLPVYARRVAEGLVDPSATPQVQRDGAVVLVDGAGALGQLVARAAVDAVAAAAADDGIAVAFVRGSSHFGSAGYYARDLADRGFVALVVSNSEPAVVPFGGADAVLGTNPIAFAAPGDPATVAVDMATSTTAYGRVYVAQDRGESIPADWGVDDDGVATTDPSQVRALLPMAGPKGFGLGLMVEILGGVMSGAAVGRGIGRMYDDFDRPQDVGHCLIAIRADAAMPRAAYDARMADLERQVTASRPAAGTERVLLPGEPEATTAADRSVHGIPLPADTVESLRALGDRVGVPFPGVA